MKKVLILLSNGFELYEAAAFTDVLGWAAVFGSEPVEIVTAGFQRRLHCTFGFDVMPDSLISQVDLNSFDALAIPGGFEKAGFYQDAYSPEFMEVIRQFEDSGKPISSICVGALPVAKSGALKGRNATTYHLLEGIRKKQLGAFGANVKDAHIVRDKNITTSSSPATAIDVASDLLERLTSKENADHILELMGFDTSKNKTNPTNH
jgi:4-methyl-5(b-hydroxyethyl)-thiazole monophosphate biosynthesis